MSFSLPCFAKINWTLRILGRRPDGFHELCTAFQTVSLHDTIEFRKDRSLRLVCDLRWMPTDERNLIIKAATALQRALGTNHGASMRLTKRIPSPGGLGGGSSNAAVALIGLSKLWGLDLGATELHSIARKIGADVPYFLHGGTCVGTGVGDVIEPLDDIGESLMLIVTPKVRVSTKAAFEKLNAPILTRSDKESNLQVCRSAAIKIDQRGTPLINDFETSVFDAYPEVGRVKETLLGFGAVNAAMSGSGASVFAIFDKTETRQAAMKALDKESTWRKFAVSTVSRSEYRGALGL